jgi:hypothetical protein
VYDLLTKLGSRWPHSLHRPVSSKVPNSQTVKRLQASASPTMNALGRSFTTRGTHSHIRRAYVRNQIIPGRWLASKWAALQAWLGCRGAPEEELLSPPDRSEEEVEPEAANMPVCFAACDAALFKSCSFEWALSKVRHCTLSQQQLLQLVMRVPTANPLENTPPCSHSAKLPCRHSYCKQLRLRETSACGPLSHAWLGQQNGGA